MAVMKKLLMVTMITIAALFMNVLAENTGESAHVSLTTFTYPPWGSIGPVTVVKTVTPEVVGNCANVPYPSGMGLIGHQCTASTSTISAEKPRTTTLITTIYTTYTRTIMVSLVHPTTSALASTTVTAMCKWADEDIITPCTTVVLQTAGAAQPTTSRSPAVPSANNPLKTAMNYIRDIYDLSAMLLGTYQEPTYEKKSVGEYTGHVGLNVHTFPPRDPKVNKCNFPQIISPYIVTVLAFLGGIVAFFYYNAYTDPHEAGCRVSIYIIITCTVYLVSFTLEHYVFNVRPHWNDCFAACYAH